MPGLLQHQQLCRPTVNNFRQFASIDWAAGEEGAACSKQAQAQAAAAATEDRLPGLAELQRAEQEQEQGSCVSGGSSRHQRPSAAAAAPLYTGSEAVFDPVSLGGSAPDRSPGGAQALPAEATVPKVACARSPPAAAPAGLWHTG
ncbi:hypothetical protein D9Q98_003973 [Chlorella vulgaris]|uniref:Uncharacterized protein n=1 Tax=Chlorella vulgaris TaxID=3077 RepID=A0A9D4TR32_CHLVU|nr:hypothetical protein D9Q98_003973 [Chlorella vulgaris]